MAAGIVALPAIATKSIIAQAGSYLVKPFATTFAVSPEPMAIAGYLGPMPGSSQAPGLLQNEAIGCQL